MSDRRPSGGEPDITAVSETLFLPLYALALESRRPDPIIVDDEAVALTQRLNERFAASDRRLFQRLAAGRLPGTLLTTVSLRIRHFDRVVREFLEREPDGVVVSLGCGLDDRRRRVDNGRVRWFDLDLPEVIEFRRAWLSETDRMRFIGRSVLDHSWMDELPDEPGSRFLFIAEGLFMYLPPDDVRALVVALRERFAGAELLCELASDWAVAQMQSRFGRGKMRRQFSLSHDVFFEFGVASGHDIEAWAEGIELIDAWNYYEDDEPKLRFMALFARMDRIRWLQWVGRFRLGRGD